MPAVVEELFVFVFLCLEERGKRLHEAEVAFHAPICIPCSTTGAKNLRNPTL